MVSYILRRIAIMIPLLILVSFISFIVIQLPPGDYVSTYVMNLQQAGGSVNAANVAALRAQYGLDQPLPLQYLTWMKGIVLHGNFGNSFVYNRPVSDILLERVRRTIAISVASIVVTWVAAVPIGILSAVRQYSVWDHTFTLLSFIGLAVPGFLLALVGVLILFHTTGFLITGLNSPDFRDAPWSIAKILDMLKNVWLPILVLAVSGIAGIARVLRASLLDELGKQYVMTARAKGLTERQILLRYPLRIAINPLLSTIGWLLPATVGGEIVVSKVLNLPTTGPILLQSLLSQDLYLTGAIILILSSLTVVGTMISDLLLAWADPRIRYGDR